MLFLLQLLLHVFISYILLQLFVALTALTAFLLQVFPGLPDREAAAAVVPAAAGPDVEPVQACADRFQGCRFCDLLPVRAGRSPAAWLGG